MRDKLLGHEGPTDIDIALDDMSGEEFANALNMWCKSTAKSPVKVGIIRCNPDKSKHLETATVNIGSFDIDFVNLRTETYTAESRIPIIEIGTPFEDAMRRDLTINALFFNVNDEHVEDFTKRGLSDLENGIVNTPLAPLETLQDDPLRALRIVRFASRLGFAIQPNVFQACGDPTVLTALSTKVSKERITTETERCLAHGNGLTAVRLFYDCGLMSVIFGLADTRAIDIETPLESLHKALDDLVWLEDSPSGRQIMQLLALEKEGHTAMLHRIALLTSWTEGEVVLHPTKKAGRGIPMVEHVLLRGAGMKMRSRDVTTIGKVHASAAHDFQQLLHDAEHAPEAVTRKRLGLALRRVGEAYPSAVALAAALARSSTGVAKLVACISRLGLEGVWHMAPMWPGDQLKRALPTGSVPEGPAFGALMEAQVEWMLSHRNGTKEECLKYLIDFVVHDEA